MEKRKGKFIVLDGTDGSGKNTQAQILIKKLKEDGYQVKKADFPQYGKKSAGLVENYLNGEYGNAEETGPLIPSIFYAADRYDASFEIEKWLEEGKIVISNRYVSSNMAHQGGKINDPKKRKKFFNWLYNLEYNLFRIPKPDLSLVLHVKPEIAQKLVDKKDPRTYINGEKRDMHEDDLDHLKKAEKIYIEIGRTLENFDIIECTDKDGIMPREKIAEKIYDKIKNKIK